MPHDIVADVGGYRAGYAIDTMVHILTSCD